MTTHAVLERLRSIRDAYGKIDSVTGALHNGSSPQEFERAVSQRFEMLGRIADEELALEAEAHGWQSYFGSDTLVGKIVREIRQLIYAITDRDVALQDIVGNKIVAIRGELLDLSSTSKAALAYVSQKDALGPRQGWA